MHLTLLLDYDLSMRWFRSILLFCILLIFIPMFVFVIQRYQTKLAPKQLSKPIPTSTTSIPSPTQTIKKTGADLSYITISGDKNINIKIKDSSGLSVGSSYTENPIVPPGETTTSMKATKVFEYPKPENGEFIVTISNPSNQSYKFDVYLYDKDGNPKVEKFTENKSVILQINYNKENLEKSVIQKVTK